MHKQSKRDFIPAFWYSAIINVNIMKTILHFSTCKYAVDNFILWNSASISVNIMKTIL